jgi:hypothetical protein
VIRLRRSVALTGHPSEHCDEAADLPAGGGSSPDRLAMDIDEDQRAA